VRKFAALVLFASFAAPFVASAAANHLSSAPAQAPVQSFSGDNDQTLRAMHDEMERSRTRLAIAGVQKPFYIEYRLLDLDVRSVTATSGALLGSSIGRNRVMSVDVRVGDYHLDSSNFISEDGFQGFLGSTGQVGIDRDYNSLRQDLWLATDQAYKSAVTQMSLKQAFLRSLTKPPEIDDFAKAPPMVKVDPRMEANWTSRKWDDEARTASAALQNFPEIYGNRVNYYIVFATTYLMTSEGTTIRTSRSLAAIEAAMDTQSEDGMPLHNAYTVYAIQPGDLPDATTVAKALNDAGAQLIALRDSSLVPDYSGPVLFTAPAAASALAQILAPSISGARPPLSMVSAFNDIMERVGGRSEWSGRMGTRVLPANVSLIDDPTMKDFQGQHLLGSYDVDDEGVKSQRVGIVENGVLKDELMSRRPGPDSDTSNGHARSADLSDTKALSSNLLFQSDDPIHAADIQKKFLAACKDDGHDWCLEVKQMDNPAVTSVQSDDFSNFIADLAGGISSGDREPLLVYRVFVADGHEELVRGGTISGLTLRSLRNILGVGDDLSVYTYMQNPEDGLAGTALGAFGSAQGGIPSTVIAPSLLLDDVEIRGFHGEPRRVPLVPPPPVK
jgi:predicted Zn-dependent protease